MKILIQLMTGRQYTCAIHAERASAEFLESVAYWEIFDRPMLRIHGQRETWALNPDYIEKIHFMTKADPGWRPPENIVASKCISRETFERKLAALDTKHLGKGVQFEAGKVTEAVVKVTLASGAVEYFDYIIMNKTPLEQRIGLSMLFQKVAHTIPCEDGGFVLLNPRRIISMHLHPAPPETADSAWLVEEFSESPAP